MYTQEMIETHPKPIDSGRRAAVIQAIEANLACAQTCTSCADACLGEEHVAHLRACIRYNLDCADICATTARLLSRQTEPPWDVIRSQLEACAAICRRCGDECERHAEMHDHCRVCAESCRQCENSCRTLLQSMG